MKFSKAKQNNLPGPKIPCSSNDQAALWHRMPSTKPEHCQVCGCPAEQLSTQVQQHRRLDMTADNKELLKKIRSTRKVNRRSKLIVKGKEKWVTREGTTSLDPPLRTQDALRRSARAVAAGLKMSDAARSAEICINTFDGWRQKYPEFWQRELKDAKKKFIAGEFTAPTLPDADEDPGIRPETKAGIRAAVAILATGISHEEAEKQLHLHPGAIANWQHDFPRYWNSCLQLATRVSQTIIKALSSESSVSPLFRVIGAADRWSRREERDAFDKVEASYAELSPSMTLSQFYYSYVKPVSLEPKSLKDLTFQEFDTSLRHWISYTGDPPVKSIDGKTCAGFVLKISQRISDKTGEKVSPNTVRKHCRAIQYMLDMLGPRNNRQRLGTGLLQDTPYLQRPRPRVKPPTDQFTIAEIENWLSACEWAHEPKGLPGVSPDTWWKCLVLFLFNTGLRIDNALELEWSMIEGNLLKIPGRIYKGGDYHEFVVSTHAIEALKPLRVLQNKYPKVFPWFQTKTSLQRHRRRIIDFSCIAFDRRFGFHGLRKALATELARVNPMIAAIALGHASVKTTAGAYIHPQVISDALNGVSQPKKK